MADPLTLERLAEIRARLEAAGPAEKWHMRHRSVSVSVSPAAGIDEYVGLGWDFALDGGPEQPNRGVLSKGADATFVHHAPTDLTDLLAEVDRLRDLVEQAYLEGWAESYRAAGRSDAITCYRYSKARAALDPSTPGEPA